MISGSPTHIGSYDVAYQKWLAARRLQDYATADRLRIEFERNHGLTIFAEGEMPVEGITVRRMRLSDWNKKYGNPEVGEILATQDSKIRYKFPQYRGLLA